MQVLRSLSSTRGLGLRVRPPSILHRTASSKVWQFCRPPSQDDQVLMGAVSYDPAISTIWEKMRVYLNTAGCPFDFMLFTNYEQQVAALLEGRIDIAWNGPIAHVLAQHFAGPGGVVSMGMRDCDRNFKSVCVARRDAAISQVGDLQGKIVATGASDSPQAHVVPLFWLRQLGVLPGNVMPFDLDLGKHGDTAVGEVAAMEALVQGKAQAALLSDMMWSRGLTGQLPSIDPKLLSESVGVVPGEGPPLFDHCQFDALSGIPSWKRDAFAGAIFKMDIKNPDHEEVMRLEGISEKWMPTREEGYDVIRRALDLPSTVPSHSVSKQPGGTRGFSSMSSSVACRSQNTTSTRKAFATFKSPLVGQRRAFSSNNKSSAPTVGVVGAGVSGLQTIRALQAKGFKVKAFEAAPKVGGVWRDNYFNFGVQVPKQLYEFPDFPFNLPWGAYPTGPQTQQYIEDYVNHFQLSESIVTDTLVKSVEPTDNGWSFTICQEGGTTAKETFDYCVVSNGLYNNSNKFLPALPGKEKFQGQVLHSSDFKSVEEVNGKNLVVVGGAKSAIDCAVEAAKAGANVTLVSRNPHWPTPRKIAWLIPFQYIFLSRLGQTLVSGHRGALPGAPTHMHLWHKLSWPIMAAAFTAVELLFAAQFKNMTGKTSPLFKADVVSDFYGYAHVLDYEARDLIEEGKLKLQIGSPDAFASGGLLVDGDMLVADMVVFGTGYQKDYSIFSKEIQAKLNIEDDGLYLWRHTVPANVPRLAFVGSELATISNISSYGLQAAWLGKHWSGEMSAPSQKEMQDEIDQMKSWKRSWMPKTSGRANLVLLHQTHFHDIMLKDMGVQHLRKWPNVFAEFFMPYEPQDYNGIVGV